MMTEDLAHLVDRGLCRMMDEDDAFDAAVSSINRDIDDSHVDITWNGIDYRITVERMD